MAKCCFGNCANWVKRVCRTPSAGHDAQMIVRIAPAAMIFVPSRGGISHNPREHTDDDQFIDGAKVLLDVVFARGGTA